MIGKIVSLAGAVALVALLVGCEVGDHRLPPDYRVTRTPDPSDYDEYGNRHQYPVPDAPYDDDDDYYDDDRRSRSRNRDYRDDDRRDSRRSQRDDRPSRAQSRDQRPRDSAPPPVAKRPAQSPNYDQPSSRNADLDLFIYFNRTSRASLETNRGLIIKRGSSGETIRVSAEDGSTINFYIHEEGRPQQLIPARTLIFRLRNDVIVGLSQS